MSTIGQSILWTQGTSLAGAQRVRHPLDQYNQVHEYRASLCTELAKGIVINCEFLWAELESCNGIIILDSLSWMFC